MLGKKNSLAVKHPELLEEWDYEKNIIKPEELSYGSSKKKVWWRCKRGHSWEASPNSRTTGKTGCPKCNLRKLINENTLVTTHPELLEEWDYEKNTIEPEELSHGSKMKVWWKCKREHSWAASPNSRTAGKTGCPKCNLRKLINENTLAVKYPELLEGWDYEKNIFKPKELSYGSHKKVWWKCKEGHFWQAAVFARTAGKTGCPKCNLRKVLNKNNLAVKHPELLEEWDYEKNIFNPQEISCGSNKKVWWKCKKGHSWQAVVYARAYTKTGCRKCRRKRS